jgi:hypothetical protein
MSGGRAHAGHRSPTARGGRDPTAGSAGAGGSRTDEHPELRRYALAIGFLIALADRDHPPRHPPARALPGGSSGIGSGAIIPASSKAIAHETVIPSDNWREVGDALLTFPALPGVVCQL